MTDVKNDKTKMEEDIIKTKFSQKIILYFLLFCLLSKCCLLWLKYSHLEEKSNFIRLSLFIILCSPDPYKGALKNYFQLVSLFINIQRKLK